MSKAPIQFRRIHLPWEESENTGYLAVVIENLFTKSECQELIQRSEESGYEQALVNVGHGRQVKMTDYRNSDRCIIDDPAQAEEIWQRILAACAQLGEKQRQELHLDQLETISVKELPHCNEPTIWYAVGLNERLRFLRYGPGGFFAPHSDGCYIRANKSGTERSQEQSFVTCQLYLNEDFAGGATRFLSHTNNPDENYAVVPRTGSVLLFHHPLYHEGCPVESGRKYAIRTDVMYTFKGPGREYSREPIVLENSTTSSAAQQNQMTASDSFDEGMMDTP